MLLPQEHILITPSLPCPPPAWDKEGASLKGLVTISVLSNDNLHAPCAEKVPALPTGEADHIRCSCSLSHGSALGRRATAEPVPSPQQRNRHKFEARHPHLALHTSLQF